MIRSQSGACLRQREPCFEAGAGATARTGYVAVRPGSWLAGGAVGAEGLEDPRENLRDLPHALGEDDEARRATNADTGARKGGRVR